MVGVISGMVIDLGQGYYQFSSRGYDYQRCVNWYPSLSEVNDSKSPTRLLGAPGKRTAVTLCPNVGTGNRGLYETAGGRVFGVWGDTLFEFDINENATDRNPLLRLTKSIGNISMSDNGTQLMIVDNGDAYIYTLSTNVLVAITDVDYPSNTNQVVYKDGFFIVSALGSKNFYVSDLANGLNWTAGNTAEIRSQPDNLTGLITTNTDLVLFGEKTIEQWQNTGNEDFTFERINGAVKDIGCKSPWSIAKINNNIYFLGSNKNGFGVVWCIIGYDIKRVSTKAIEEILESSKDTTGAIGYTYQEKGYYFYVLTIPNIDKTFVYEESTNRWHERGFWDVLAGEYNKDKSSHHVFAFGKNYVGYDNNNLLSELDDKTYTDNADTIRRVMTTHHVQSENNRINVKELKLDYERSSALQNGQGSDPQMMMRYSKDGGYNYSTDIFRDMGAIGNYNQQITWTNLGVGRDYVFELSVSDPVKADLYALYVNVEVLKT
jgi:hypothetical protein